MAFLRSSHVIRTPYSLPRHLIGRCFAFLCSVASLALLGCPATSPIIAPPPPPSLTQTVPRGETPQDVFTRAEGLRRAGQTSEAVQAFSDFVKRYPSDALTDDALLALGDLSASSKRYRKALVYYRALLHQFPRSTHRAAAHFGVGLTLYETRDFDDSLVALKKALSAPSGNTYWGQAHYYQGEIAFRQKRYADAFKALQTAMGTNPDPTLATRAQRRLSSIVSDHLTLSDLNTLAAQYATTSPGDLLLYQLAQKHQEAGNSMAEADALRRFTAHFPAHAEAPSALERLHSLEVSLSNDPTKLGVILPLYGNGRQAGQRALWGLQLALATLQQSHPDLQLSLVIRDEGVTTTVAQEALRSLVDEARVIGVIGPLFSQTASDLAPLTAELGVSLISPYARDSDFPALSPYAFRNSLTDAAQGRALANYAMNVLSLKRFAVLYPDDSYGTTLKNQFIKHIKRLRGQIIVAASYPPDAADFRQVVEQIKGKEYEALFLPDYADNITRLAPLLATGTAPGVQLLGTDGWNAPEITQIADQAIRGATFVDGFFVGAAAPHVKTFVAQFRQRHGEAPDLVAAQAYDTLLLCAEVLKGGATTRAEFRDGLLRLRDFTGVSGLTSFNANGDANKIPYLLMIRNGKIQQVDTQPGL